MLVDSNNDGVPDVAATQSVLIDLTPPPPPDPATVSVVGGNQALVINWQGVDTGLYHRPARLPDPLQPRRRSAGVLRRNVPPRLPELRDPRAGVGTIDPTFDGGVQSLNPLFACSPLLSATTQLVTG